jgi:hypothetical protein
MFCSESGLSMAKTDLGSSERRGTWHVGAGLLMVMALAVPIASLTANHVTLYSLRLLDHPFATAVALLPIIALLVLPVFHVKLARWKNALAFIGLALVTCAVGYWWLATIAFGQMTPQQTQELVTTYSLMYMAGDNTMSEAFLALTLGLVKLGFGYYSLLAALIIMTCSYCGATFSRRRPSDDASGRISINIPLPSSDGVN